MKFFLDTANLSEIEDAISKGVVSGVTTNPSILSKEPKTDFLEHIEKIAKLCKSGGNLPLSVEVFAQDPEGMLKQSYDLLDKVSYDFLNIKIPIGYQELQVINKLSSDGVDVNCTCCFTTTQLQMGAAAGAAYVSLFYNRLKEVGGDPKIVLERTRKFLDEEYPDCKIIAGSIRQPWDLEDAWDAGADIVTASYNILVKSTRHPKTDESVNQFLNDFEKWIK